VNGEGKAPWLLWKDSTNVWNLHSTNHTYSGVCVQYNDCLVRVQLPSQNYSNKTCCSKIEVIASQFPRSASQTKFQLWNGLFSKNVAFPVHLC